jgi:hypothetical protein
VLIWEISHNISVLIQHPLEKYQKTPDPKRVEKGIKNRAGQVVTYDVTTLRNEAKV